MAELKLISEQRKINYTGIFSVHDFVKDTVDFLAKKGFFCFEKYQNDVVSDKGRSLTFKVDFQKELNYYARVVFQTTFNFKGITDVDVLQGKKKVMLNKGTASVAINCVLMTDKEGRYEANFYMFVFKAFAEKFFFRKEIDHMSKIAEREFKKTINYIHGYFNLQKYN